MMMEEEKEKEVTYCLDQSEGGEGGTKRWGEESKRQQRGSSLKPLRKLAVAKMVSAISSCLDSECLRVKI